MIQEKVAQRPAASGETPMLLALRNVGKVFSNGVTALSKVDLAIREGDFLSLLGPSGCGKSTALSAVTPLENTLPTPRSASKVGATSDAGACANFSPIMPRPAYFFRSSPTPLLTKANV